MIGKQEWFQRRKYLGWGLHPKTWQGWVYILVFILLAIIIQFLPLVNITKFIVTSVLILILLIDVIHIMITMKKDERDKKHEAIADRNALWVMLLVIVVGILYQTVNSTLNGLTPEIDYFLISALLVGVIMKCITNIYLDKKD
jgi:CDP-diglyceride synthetase